MPRLNPYPRALEGPERTYEIHEVTRLTGLGSARLRAWERRYALVRPSRQANGYRAYTAQQVALLRALARLIDEGDRIGELVRRPIEEILAAAQDREDSGSMQGALLEAAREFDRDRLEALVAQQLILRGLVCFAYGVALPLAQDIGDQWALGKLPVAAEHLASEVVVHALKGALRIQRGNGPICLAACLPGERHEWGLLSTLAEVQDKGWRIHYLGCDLPLEGVAEAAWRLQAGAVALSVSEATNITSYLPALSHFLAHLPPRAFAVIGGSGTVRHERTLESYGFRTGIDAFDMTDARKHGSNQEVRGLP